VLHARRERLKELAEREAEGASLWSPRFEKTARVRLLHIFNAETHGRSSYPVFARRLILEDEGLLFLDDAHVGKVEDFRSYLLNCDSTMMPTVIEAMYEASSDESLQSTSHLHEAARGFCDGVNSVLSEYRISFELIGGEMIGFESREMHVEVVEPTLKLLAGRSDLRKVEIAYHNALHEIADDKASDAITDAGTALQETLQALGCSGNALGPLIKSARKAGLLGAHDGPLLDAYERLLNWVSAERSEHGDSHSANVVGQADGWLMVHMVGALILRLTSESATRGKSK
jgi:hypothetical protein